MKNKPNEPIKPPTKQQIINLMVDEAMKRRDQVILNFDSEIEALEKKAIDIASKNKVPPVSKMEVTVNPYKASVEFTYYVGNKAIGDIINKIRETRQRRNFERKKTKAKITSEIRQKIGSPAPAITDPETLKSVNDRLTQWGY